MKCSAFQNRIWLSSPTMHGDELKYITEAYETNWMTTEGANLTAIERSVCEKVGCQYAVPLASGTAALHLAIKLAGVKAGDHVFCSDMTFAATVNAIAYENAEPVFIDSEYDTWNMDPDALQKAFELYPDTRVIVVVNLYGTPAKYRQICDIANEHGAIVIEDAAESFGAMYEGRQTGLFGRYSVISFNGNKIITGAAGGMLLTNERTAAEKARKWSTQSRENAPWYQHEERGYNYRMSNVTAGVVRGQIPYLDVHIAQKKAIYERYKEGFKDLPVSMNPFDPDTMEPNYWMSCMLIDEEAMCRQDRGNTSSTYVSEKGKTCPDEVLDTLNRVNAQGRPIWKPMHMQPLYKDHAFVTREGKWDPAVQNGENRAINVGEDLFRRGLCLPSDNKITAEEQSQIIEIVRSCFD